MKQLDNAALADLIREAANVPRRRKNLNLHPLPDDPVQRLLNALEPGTYIRPHRHTEPSKWELFAILSGRAVVLTFDDAGRVTSRVVLDAQDGVRIVEIPEAAWHTLAALASGTVLLEIKRGPYQPTAPQQFAAWAPEEGAAAAAGFERWFLRAAPGDSPPG